MSLGCEEFGERTCFVILSVSEGPPYFCRGSFGVFAPQDDEKKTGRGLGLGRGFGPVNEPGPEPGLPLSDFFTTSDRMTL